MTERPFLATAAEVRAILANKQTQFRRPVKVCRKDSNGVFRGGRPIIPTEYGPHEGVIGYHPRPDGAMKGRSRYVAYLLPEMGLAWRPYGGSPDVPWPAERIGEVCPFGGVGDRLWCRETYSHVSGAGVRVVYRADGTPKDRFRGTPIEGMKWAPPLAMPRGYSRITLEIVGVKIERIQDISEADAIASGYGSAFGPGMFSRGFQSYWDEVYGERSPAHLNPWSWAVDFKVAA